MGFEEALAEIPLGVRVSSQPEARALADVPAFAGGLSKGLPIAIARRSRSNNVLSEAGGLLIIGHLVGG